MFKFQARDYVVCSILVYVVLIVLSTILQDKHAASNHVSTPFSSPCFYNRSCVRFCCFDKELCKKNVIRKNFNSSILPFDLSEEYLNDTMDYKIVLGSPLCRLNEVAASDFNKSWSFAHVRTVDILSC